MKFSVLNQYHLEMKWKNEYNVSKMENLQEKMNPYSDRKITSSPNRNAMQVFSEGLKEMNDAIFPKASLPSGLLIFEPAREAFK